MLKSFLGDGTVQGLRKGDETEAIFEGRTHDAGQTGSFPSQESRYM